MTNHEHDKHSTKCMREAARIVGFELSDVYHWTYTCLHWLATYGEVSILGSDELGWSVSVESQADPAFGQSADIHVSSGGHSFPEALCGAVHAVKYAEDAKVKGLL